MLLSFIRSRGRLYLPGQINKSLWFVSFKVKTQLENPTRYYVAQQQKRQLKEYLKNQGPPSLSLPNLLSSTQSQPTLNAINQQAVATLATGSFPGVLQAPASPMTGMNAEAGATSNVEVSTVVFLMGWLIMKPVGWLCIILWQCISSEVTPCVGCN